MKRSYEVVKRVFDVSVSAFVLLAGAPLWLLSALLIKFSSPGPVLFVQPVLGKNGREFLLYKFRTMRVASNGADHHQALLQNMTQKKPTGHDRQGRPIYKTALVDERRITPVGRYLRRISLDEFPQLWNVLRGEMSLVGPRPSLPHEAALYREEQRQRLRVQPGITGLYQVTARNRVPIEEMIRIDLEYIRHRSFLYDLWIILQTSAAMFRGL